MICMHMRGTHGMCMPERTSLSRPWQPVEVSVTLATAPIARLRTRAIELLPLAAVPATLGSPVWVGVGS